MTTRCKFVCNSITKTLHNTIPAKRTLYEASFSAVYDGSEENKKFFEWTPSGSLKIGLYKEDVFEVGKEYYLDVTAA